MGLGRPSERFHKGGGLLTSPALVAKPVSDTFVDVIYIYVDLHCRIGFVQR